MTKMDEVICYVSLIVGKGEPRIHINLPRKLIRELLGRYVNLLDDCFRGLILERKRPGIDAARKIVWDDHHGRGSDETFDHIDLPLSYAGCDFDSIPQPTKSAQLRGVVKVDKDVVRLILDPIDLGRLEPRTPRRKVSKGSSAKARSVTPSLL